MPAISGLGPRFRIVTDEGLQDAMNQLQNELKDLKVGSPQYKFEELQLAREERELEIRKENPDLDRSTQEGQRALAQLMGEDPTLQEINSKIQSLVNAYPNEVSSWGFPMGSSMP